MKLESRAAAAEDEMKSHAFPGVKLSASTVGRLPSPVRVPGYRRRAITPAIAHIGVGGFFRAHQAVYLDDLLHGTAYPEWGICGVGLLDRDSLMRDALVPQDCLYTVIECGIGGEAARVIGSMTEYLYAPENPERVLEKLASPATRIVSLTITEGGYYLDHGTGGFGDRHPDIVRDLEHPHEPRCSFGYIVEALARRCSRGLPGFTVMSCDNLQQNGEIARKMLLAFAALRDPALGAWIAEHCAFPNSMVDRITPMTEDRHRTILRERFGIEDAWPVITESFRQWVIEDRFPQGRPTWEAAGAQMTSDVLPYEKNKIRLLNAGHQALCHPGRLLGYRSVHESIADPQIHAFVRALMDLEVSPLLREVPGMKLGSYKDTLVERFANPAINDQLSRIAMEGSDRMPKFVFPSLIEQLARGGPVTLLTLVVACWFRCLAGTDEQEQDLPLVDPLSDTLRERALLGGADPRPLLGIDRLFGPELAGSRRFVDELAQALSSLYESGVRATLEKYLRR